MSDVILAQLVQTPAPIEIPPSEPPARPLAELMERLTGSELLGAFIANLVEPVLQLVLIIVVAAVASRLVKGLIRRLVDQARDPASNERLGRMKQRVRFGRMSADEKPKTPSTRRLTRVDALGALAGSVAAFVIWTIAVFTIFGTVFGLDLAPLIAGAGIVGLALGFGAQDLVNDFLSGIFMLAEDQYGVGDIIDAGEAVGTVEGVGLRTTRVRDLEGTQWHIPNGEIRRVGNMSQDWARTLLDVGVGYATDTDRASEVILGVATEMAHDEGYASDFLEEPKVWGVQSLGADSVEIRLVIKTTPGTQWAIGRELRRRIKHALEANDIEIPFPQRTVWLRTDKQGSSAAPVVHIDGDGVEPAPTSTTSSSEPGGSGRPRKRATARKRSR